MNSIFAPKSRSLADVKAGLGSQLESDAVCLRFHVTAERQLQDKRGDFVEKPVCDHGDSVVGQEAPKHGHWYDQQQADEVSVA